MKKIMLYAIPAVLLIVTALIYSIVEFPQLASSEDKEAAENAEMESDRATEENKKDNDNNSGDQESSNGTSSENNEGSGAERIFFMSDTYFYIDRSEHEDAINYKEGKKEEAKEIIGELHEIMNNLVGFGKVEVINFHSLRNDKYFDTDAFHDRLSALQEDLLAESRALYDIRNLQNFYMMGSSYETEDRMALRYAHRIIHDLDIYVNGDGEKDERRIWGVTEAYGNDSDIDKMYDYIRNYGE
ncbi:hypothetical protein [Salipaludibacillus aurantiacus]|uniref:Uncharacterized protein n=1 Tax=Salipaludibacillus aurantiacus TaxID=1601833 RepID=A0A1H9SK75_9BACI|nr:hypothetical protein [Salipaludibacillus aurantiacus]SER85382.1 hypothetical protein SAMN05518684_104270 [Salipaludibacillus aurantiacus]